MRFVEPKDIPCAYAARGCTFVAKSEPDFMTHTLLHASSRRPAPGTQGEIYWLQYGVTEAQIESQAQPCPKCDERHGGRYGSGPMFKGLSAVQAHVREAHPELVGGA